ncbi:unnamed protein product, partial [marine sediment metagenome]
TACSEKEIIETAAASLGLDEAAPFDPHEKIIEYRIRGFSGAQVEGQVIGPD